jgi:sugar phosphate isomerase/epimerase
VKLGLLTAAFPDLTLDEVAGWASAEGFEMLEVACWPSSGGEKRRYAGVSHIDVERVDADAVHAMFERAGLEISSLAYYPNNLDPDPEAREAANEHLRKVVDAAQALGVAIVGTFVGRDKIRTISENLAEFRKVWPPLVDYAGERGVRLMIENCVMEGWHPDGYPGNLAYSPELWEWMFALGLYLNYDPSHLLWLGIDPVEALRPYVTYVAHAHAKDAETFPAQRNRFGFFGRTSTREEDPWDMGWWRYRIPGLGEVDFRRCVDTLYEGGFDGVLSVEHEDPVWGGSPEMVEAGLRIAHHNLSGLVVQ